MTRLARSRLLSQRDPEKIMTRRPAWTLDRDGRSLPPVLEGVPAGRYVLQQTA